MLLESLESWKASSRFWKGFTFNPTIGAIAGSSVWAGWGVFFCQREFHTAAEEKGYIYHPTIVQLCTRTAALTLLYHQLLLPNSLQQTTTHPVQHHLHLHDSTKSPQNELNNSLNLCSHCLFHVSLAVYCKSKSKLWWPHLWALKICQVLLLTPFVRLSQQYLLQSPKNQDIEMSLGPPDTNALQILIYTTHRNQRKFSLLTRIQ